MLENARAKKRRLNPARGQHRNTWKLRSWSRRADQRRIGGMIVAARGDHRHRAIVLNTIRILVDALVQLRGSTQSERPEKCGGDANCNRRAPSIC